MPARQPHLMFGQICEASIRQQNAEETSEAVGPDVDNFPKTMVIDARGDLPMRIGQHFHSVVKSKKGFPVFLNSNELVVTILQRILRKVDVLVVRSHCGEPSFRKFFRQNFKKALLPSKFCQATSKWLLKYIIP